MLKFKIGVIIAGIVLFGLFVWGIHRKGWNEGWNDCQLEQDGKYKQAYLDAQSQIKAQEFLNQEIINNQASTIENYKKQVENSDDQAHKEISSHAVYSECKLTAEWMRLKSSRVDTTNKAISSS